MEIGTMFGDAYEYTKDALWGKWTRWLILLVGTIIFPIILGYTYLIYRGERMPPDPQDWVAVFVDGIKLFIVQLVYAIPVIIVNLVLNLLFLMPVTTSGGMDGSAEGMSGAVACFLFRHSRILSIKNNPTHSAEFNNHARPCIKKQTLLYICTSV
jgi:hypothetical protein